MYIFNQNKSNSGFTLIEVLVSTLIVGMILSSIFFTLGFLNINLDRLTKNHKHYEAFISSLSIIEQDLKTLSTRTVRDEFGDFEPSIIINDKSDKKMIFSRLIFDEKKLTHHTYRIEYHFSNQSLKRNIWDVLDRVQNSDYQTQYLDKNIRDISISVTDNNLQWYQVWPVGYSFNDEKDLLSIEMKFRDKIKAYQDLASGKFNTIKMPLAFKILIKHKYFGDIERVILSQI